MHINNNCEFKKITSIQIDGDISKLFLRVFANKFDEEEDMKPPNITPMSLNRKKRQVLERKRRRREATKYYFQRHLPFGDA